MKQSKYPAGWNERKVRSVLKHYESQTEEQAVAEDEAAFMSKPMVLKIALANLHGGTDPEAIFNFIETNGVDIEAYRLDRGKVSAAAIDYIVVLTAFGSIASVAQLLWMAYDRFIAAKKPREDDTEGIYIHLDSEGNNEFWLGNNDKDKELFIETFTKKVSAFRETERAEEIYEKTQEEMRHSGIWIRRR